MEDYKIKDEFDRLHAKSESKVSNTIFYWIIGGLFAGYLVAFFYILNRIDSLNTWQIDHDKIIKLETQIQNIKK